MDENIEKKSPLLPILGVLVVFWIIYYLLSKLLKLIFKKKTSRKTYSNNTKPSYYKKPFKQKKKKPRIFVSHSWSHDEDYNRLIKAFKSLNFKFYNHSIPEYKAQDLKTGGEIEQKINNQLLYSRCLLVLGGNYSEKYWIKKEVEIAKSLQKKVIVVRPWNTNEIPDYLKNSADDIVDFIPKEIIKLII
jgi:hypothetical protein